MTYSDASLGSLALPGPVGSSHSWAPLGVTGSPRAPDSWSRTAWLDRNQLFGVLPALLGFSATARSVFNAHSRVLWVCPCPVLPPLWGDCVHVKPELLTRLCGSVGDARYLHTKAQMLVRLQLLTQQLLLLLLFCFLPPPGGPQGLLLALLDSGVPPGGLGGGD